MTSHERLSHERLIADSEILKHILKTDTIRQQRSRISKFKTSIQSYEIGTLIGQGSFGKVYKAKEKANGNIYAVKKKEAFYNKNIESKSNAHYEYLILRRNMKHENIVAFERLLIDENYYYYFFEYCSNGDLHCFKKKYKQSNSVIPANLVWKLAFQLSEAVDFIHNNNIIHMDIKCDNLFLDTNNNLKLGDFDGAIDMSNHDTKDRIVRSQYIKQTSTRSDIPPCYAPELIRGDAFSFKVDMWAIGVVIYELTTLQSINNVCTIIDSENTVSRKDVEIKSNELNFGLHSIVDDSFLLKLYGSILLSQEPSRYTSTQFNILMKLGPDLLNVNKNKLVTF